MSGSPVASAAERAPRTSRGARAPRAPRTSAGAAPTLRAARAAARRPRRESIRPHPSSARAPLVRAHPLVEAGRARLQLADVAFALELLDHAPRDLHAGEPDFGGKAGVRSVHGWLLAWGRLRARTEKKGGALAPRDPEVPLGHVRAECDLVSLIPLRSHVGG